MVSFIFIFCSIIIGLSLYFNNKTALSPNKNMLLGVTLPYNKLENIDVTAIVEKYKKSYVKLILIALIFSIAMIFMESYPSITLIYMFLWVILLFYFNNRLYVKYFKELYSLKEKNNWFIIDKDYDEDKYWEKGYYYNPEDKRTSVEKRIGYGYTYNLATKKGKWLTIAPSAFAVILVLSLSVMFLIFDFSDFKLSINENKVKISAPLYGYSFNREDIEEVTKIPSLPKGMRVNGVGTARYNLGNFNLNVYGKSKLYVYNDNPPYILIKLKDKYLILNGKTKEITEQYYNMLKK